MPRSPSFHFLARHWAEVVGRLGLGVRLRLERAGFFPRGEGCVRAEVAPWPRPAALDLSRRGALVAVRGIAGAARLRGDVARRAADAARALLWEERRIEREWEVADVVAASPGAFLQVEAVFETGRAAFGLLGRAGPARGAARGAGRPARPEVHRGRGGRRRPLARRPARRAPGRRRGGRAPPDVGGDVPPRDGGGGAAAVRRPGLDLGPAGRAGRPRGGTRLTGARRRPRMERT